MNCQHKTQNPIETTKILMGIRYISYWLQCMHRRFDCDSWLLLNTFLVVRWCVDVINFHYGLCHQKKTKKNPNVTLRLLWRASFDSCIAMQESSFFSLWRGFCFSSLIIVSIDFDIFLPAIANLANQDFLESKIHFLKKLAGNSAKF